MDTIHPDATPIIKEGNVQIGWQLETRDFMFQAIESRDGHVDSYVLWGDDQPGDVAQHPSWANAKRWLDVLLQSSRR